MRTGLGISRAIGAAFALILASSAFAADDGTWSVKKSSGEVWVGASGAQQASVKSDEVLKPGDTIRTGRNGRVLLVRGEESILIAPNSVVGIPAEKKEGLSTTIKQQAGSILLEVEKKNVKHFEVETPYLAAVVKGTQFRVTVNASGATVDVVRGQVEVADFKSGQIAQVMPGQHATAFSSGNAGLSLGGSGALQPIQNGPPRASGIDRVPVPRNGLSAPDKPRSASGAKHGATRISSALGEVRVNVNRVTHGLARSAGAVAGTRSATNRDNSTVWASADSGSGSAGSTGAGNASTGGNSSGNGNGGGSNSAGGNNGSAAGGNSGGGAVAGVVGGVGGAVGGVVGGVGGAVGGVVGGVGGTVGGVVGGVGGTVGGVVGGVGGVVGGVLGGVNGNGNGNGNNGNHYGWFKR